MTEQQYNHEEVKELFDVVFKLSAKDINDKLIKVRNRPEIAKRRWFWELLQNAKDSVSKDEKVDIRLVISKNANGIPFIDFSHNGNPFKYEDAKNLIFPYSDKDEEENSDKSGRFGTGFLATHILSPKIQVKGVYLKESSAFNFNFTLDRSANGKTELAESINKTWHSFRNNKVENPEYIYDKTKFDTHFIYPLDSESLIVAQESIEDFQKSLPFALTFIPKINSVQIENKIDNKSIRYNVNNSKTLLLTENIKETVVLKKELIPTSNFDEIIIITCFGDDINVSFEVIKDQGEVQIKEIEKQQPVLFCPFPLIGADEFPFPIILNSEKFTPKEERNGIWLSNTKEGLENQKVFEKALPLFESLIEYVSIQKFKRCYSLFKTLKNEPRFPDLDIEWYKNLIQEKLKEVLLKKSIVDNHDGERKFVKEINFPFNDSYIVRESLWTSLREYNKSAVPAYDELHKWYEVLWVGTPRISLEVFAKHISSRKNITELAKNFNNEKEKTLVWLNSLVDLITKNENPLLNEDVSAILPNQFGIFKRKDELYLDDDTIDDTVKEIFATIGKFKVGIVDWRNELLEKKIFLELPENKTRGIEEISVLLVEYIKELLKADDPSNEMQDLFSTLLNWLSENKELQNKYFKGLKTETLLYKTTDEAKLKQFTEILRKDRDGEISVDDLVNLDTTKLELLNDPDLELKLKLGEQAIEGMLKEKLEFEFKKQTGDIFEKVFHEIINSDNRFNIQKVEGEEDFIITNKIDNREFYVELKSIKSEDVKVQMTHKQAKKAYNYPQNYFLCYIPNNGSIIDEHYFKANAQFDGEIGTKLADKVNKALRFEAAENGIAIEFEDLLLQQYKKYRYKFVIDREILTHESLDMFKNRILN
ncbi:sacsin N-terminal ATP-binding-like domain-containing protein [Winogradskyella poriferorum]|uniref:sacsin N-terminal ATP-binding-like domain-containing protein n=1 Tax=Winogradskyella poriferorum TaxID=307627 RepID=UPI003D653EA6